MNTVKEVMGIKERRTYVSHRQVKMLQGRRCDTAEGHPGATIGKRQGEPADKSRARQIKAETGR